LSTGRKGEDSFSKREFSFTLANDIYMRCDSRAARQGLRSAFSCLVRAECNSMVVAGGGLAAHQGAAGTAGEDRAVWTCKAHSLRAMLTVCLAASLSEKLFSGLTWWHAGS